MKEPLKTYFPPDDINSRKNPLYVKLFDSFDRADGKMTDSEKKVCFYHILSVCVSLSLSEMLAIEV